MLIIHVGKDQENKIKVGELMHKHHEGLQRKMQRDREVVIRFEKVTQPLNDHRRNSMPSPHYTSTSWIFVAMCRGFGIEWGRMS